ncbi:MAG: NfeD family protein [Deltaproteobacteria bacterium]
MWMKWLILAGLLFVGEIVTAGFILFWFGVSAVIAAILSFAGVSLYIQGTVFVLAAAILIIFTRPLTKGLLKPKDNPTNVFAIVGKKGMVIQEINNVQGLGQVKISGEVWSAEAEDGAGIPVDTQVEIVKVEGVRVIVKPVIQKEVNE